MTEQETNDAVVNPLVTSAETDKIFPALLTARKAMPELARDQEHVVKTKSGHVYKVHSEDLASLIEVMVGELLEHGVLWTFDTRETADRIVGYSYLIHAASGQWMRAEGYLAKVGAAWDVGSAHTFLRRYLLRNQLGVQPHGFDDDGKAAQKGAEREAVRRERQRERMDAEEKDRAERSTRYKAAAKRGELTMSEAREKAEAFAAACFHREVGKLSGEQFGVLLDLLSEGGDLPDSYLDNELTLSEDIRASVEAWQGRAAGGGGVAAELARVAGPDISLDDARAWTRELLDEDVDGMMPGARLDAVRLYMYLSGHESLARAIGALGEGDAATGVARLWTFMGKPEVLLAQPPERVIEKLESIDRGDAK